jgi:5-formyltetrahydrofolate cyclo-ligase
VEGDAVLPDVLLAPLVGFDAGGYRLGYGGGYYDRTLAALPERPRVVGVGFEPSGLETIHPQPHDIPMDLVVTERRTIRIADAAAGRMGGSTLAGIADPTQEHGTEECQ